MYRLLVVLALALLAQVCLAREIRVDSANSIRTVLKTDGQRVQHIIHNGILAKDTGIPNHPEEVSYREVTNGKELVQAIIQGRDNVKDCAIKTSADAVTTFTETFVTGQFQLSEQFETEDIIALESEEPLPENIRHIADFHSLLKKCRDHHKSVKLSLQGYSGTSRKRRAIVRGRAIDEGEESEFGIFPGTKWCGRGATTHRYEDLGANRGTDRCCRAHDHCPFFINALQTKYGYFNFRLQTLTHCDCDRVFRTCLHGRSDPTADMVGELFFNTLRLKCFTFVEKRVCKKWSSWLFTNCERYETEFEVAVHDAVRY